MGNANFLPGRDADLLAWSVNFRVLINLHPDWYGLGSPQATQYGNLHDAFAAALQTATNPATRSPGNITAKDVAKRALTTDARVLAGIIQKFPGTNDTNRANLGLTVPTGSRTPVPVPTTSPMIDVVNVAGRVVSVRLHDALAGTGAKRSSKPAGVAGATVFSFVGDAVPNDMAAWKYEGQMTRTTFDLSFAPTLAPGTTVWVTAFWYNPRGQSGPAANPTSAVIQFGGLSKKAA